MNKLDEIFAHKREEVARQKAAVPLAEIRTQAAAAPPPRDIVAALRGAPSRPALIAEIKRGSPSRGLLAPDFDPLRLARIYAENGATAISVLTDERYFGGSLDHLRAVAGLGLNLPLLRKDFLCDPYQVYQARAAGADAVLLIVAALAPIMLTGLHGLACSLGMAALVEVHSIAELDAALAIEPALVGINNRDLHDFTISLETTARLALRVPADVCVVAESGIHTPEDVARLREIPRPGGQRGVNAILVGEALVTAPDVGAKVRALVGPPENVDGRLTMDDDRRLPIRRGRGAAPGMED